MRNRETVAATARIFPQNWIIDERQKTTTDRQERVDWRIQQKSAAAQHVGAEAEH
jgi:hypothetical protein